MLPAARVPAVLDGAIVARVIQTPISDDLPHVVMIFEHCILLFVVAVIRVQNLCVCGHGESSSRFGPAEVVLTFHRRTEKDGMHVREAKNSA